MTQTTNPIVTVYEIYVLILITYSDQVLVACAIHDESLGSQLLKIISEI